MSVLTIRAHRRYALRMPARLKGEGRKSAPCLLIELSQQGARLSNLDQVDFRPGDSVRLLTECGTELECTIRWAHDGRAGVRLEQSLHAPELSAMLDTYRRENAAA
ncbi:PilZ domain-containing protein [Aurantiacibacter luteus]|uniref:PilZ domain-containing protein n=1 Tax=Aurantiacibacter luteus TaxID=1581420 RepID=A0A0G9MY72_9SPHN|nr:PilZ domain-containing protein [Aurantiacibacter luteus]KLE35727.1 hypothetical protein AAW00_04870 [Aurantiacibacter luteus]